LVEDHPRGYGIAGRRVVDLLALPLDPTDFLMEHPRAVPKSFPSCGELPVVLGVMPPRGGNHPPHLSMISSHLVGLDVSFQPLCPPHGLDGLRGQFLPQHPEQSLLLFGFTLPHHEDFPATVGIRLW
jgi:hypothetical protein